MVVKENGRDEIFNLVQGFIDSSISSNVGRYLRNVVPRGRLPCLYRSCPVTRLATSMPQITSRVPTVRFVA